MFYLVTGTIIQTMSSARSLTEKDTQLVKTMRGEKSAVSIFIRYHYSMAKEMGMANVEILHINTKPVGRAVNKLRSHRGYPTSR